MLWPQGVYDIAIPGLVLSGQCAAGSYWTVLLLVVMGFLWLIEFGFHFVWISAFFSSVDRLPIQIPQPELLFQLLR